MVVNLLSKYKKQKSKVNHFTPLSTTLWISSEKMSHFLVKLGEKVQSQQPHLCLCSVYLSANSYDF